MIGFFTHHIQKINCTKTANYIIFIAYLQNTILYENKAIQPNLCNSCWILFICHLHVSCSHRLRPLNTINDQHRLGQQSGGGLSWSL